jgi:hypothetical protein
LWASWNQRSVRGLGVYVENEDCGGTLDVSTFSSSFLASFAAFFAFLAAFRTSFVFLDIRSGPLMTFIQHKVRAYESSHLNELAWVTPDGNEPSEACKTVKPWRKMPCVS